MRMTRYRVRVERRDGDNAFGASQGFSVHVENDDEDVLDYIFTMLIAAARHISEPRAWKVTYNAASAKAQRGRRRKL